MNSRQDAALHAIWETAVNAAHGEWNMRNEWNSASAQVAHDGLHQAYNWLFGLQLSFHENPDMRFATQLLTLIKHADCDARRYC